MSVYAMYGKKANKWLKFKSRDAYEVNSSVLATFRYVMAFSNWEVFVSTRSLMDTIYPPLYM